MGIIQEDLKKFLSVNENKIVSHGQFRAIDFNNLQKVLEGTKEDFLIFDNAGGAKFEIVFDRIISPESSISAKLTIEHFLDNHKKYIYSYQINEEQFLLKTL